MEQKRLCPYCMGELPPAADSCVHCGRVFAGRNPAGCLPVGTVLAGRYTVGEMRSLDGEGILYRGVENLGCFRVTIKEYLPVTLSAERGADCILQPKTGSEVLFKTTRMDFADLYRALERITPATGLEAVLDVVEANNTVYAVMENLGGTPLDQWLEAQGAPLRPDDACAMLQPVFEGVAAMHKIGLVHRGICPENLRVMADGRCRLAGYATVGLRTAGSGLREQLYEGYSALEQYSTAEFEGRYTDEYGLAAVFYRMVCGQAPVPAAQRMVSDSNPRARTVNSAVPGYVSDVLQMGLRLKPMERIQTVPQLVQALSSKEYTEELGRTMKPETPVGQPEEKAHLLSVKGLLAGILILLAISAGAHGVDHGEPQPALGVVGIGGAGTGQQRGAGAPESGAQLHRHGLRPGAEQPGVHRHVPVLRHRGVQRHRPGRADHDPGTGGGHGAQGRGDHSSGGQQGPAEGGNAHHHRLYTGRRRRGAAEPRPAGQLLYGGERRLLCRRMRGVGQ